MFIYVLGALLWPSGASEASAGSSFMGRKGQAAASSDKKRTKAALAPSLSVSSEHFQALILRLTARRP